MSDKTPGSDEFDELTDPQVATPSSQDDHRAVDDPLVPLEETLAPETDVVDGDDLDEVDVDEVAPEDTDAVTSGATAMAAGGVTRRTSPAPVRKKDLAVAEAAATPSRTTRTPVKKGVATRKQSDTEHVEDDPYGATDPVTFVKQSAEELGKVVWPTWPQLVQYFIAVLLFVLFFIAFVGVLDLLFGWGLLSLFGERS